MFRPSPATFKFGTSKEHIMNERFTPRYVVLHSETKRPIGKEWQLHSFDAGELARRLSIKPDLMVGLLLGPASGVVDVEYDSPEGQEEFERLLGDVVTPCWASTRSKHSIFLWDDRLLALKSKVTIDGIEYRLGGSSAAQSVCPPSLVDGVRREWLRSPDDCEIQRLPESEIQRLLDYKSAHCFRAKDFEPSPFQGFDELEKLGHVLQTEAALKIQAYLKAYGFQIGFDHRPDNVVELHLDRCPFKPIEQEEKDGAPLVYVNNDGSYNFCCLHAKDEGKKWKEVEEVLGKKLNEPVAIDILANWCEVIEPLIAKKHNGRQYVNAVGLASTKYELTYLIEDVLVADQPCVWGAAEKCFKTSLAVDMAVSLATGTPFLGTFKVPSPVPAYLISGESGLGSLQRRLKTVCKARGVVLPDNLFFDLCEDPMPQFASKTSLKQLSDTIKENGARVVLIDPVYFCLDGVEHADVCEMGSALGKVNQVCKDNGANLVLIHHFRKAKAGEEYREPELTEISQAGFREWTRQWFMLWKRAPFDPGNIQKLGIKIGGSAGHSSRWSLELDEGTKDAPRWVTTLASLEEVKADETVEMLSGRLLDAITNFPSGVAKTKLFRAAGIDKAYHRMTALEQLVTEGSIIRFEGLDGANHQREYYKAAQA